MEAEEGKERAKPNRSESLFFLCCVRAVLGDGRLLRVLLCIECKMCREGEGEEEDEDEEEEEVSYAMLCDCAVAGRGKDGITVVSFFFFFFLFFFYTHKRCA